MTRGYFQSLTEPTAADFWRGVCIQRTEGSEVLSDQDNIGVEILVLSSVTLISNVGLLTPEALTGEQNENEPISNKEPSLDNDEEKSILIGDFCVQPTSTPRMVILSKTGIIEDLVYL